jgi:hypothetical protein
MQKFDQYTIRNRAKFSDNGGCGYLLKPIHLRKNIEFEHTCHPYQLTVQVCVVFLRN